MDGQLVTAMTLYECRPGMPGEGGRLGQVSRHTRLSKMWQWRWTVPFPSRGWCHTRPRCQSAHRTTTYDNVSLTHNLILSNNSSHQSVIIMPRPPSTHENSNNANTVSL